MMKRFKEICKMPQPQLKHSLKKELKKIYSIVENQDGFLYAKGTFPVLLVAHLDTVHLKLPNVINTRDGILSSPNGIGGDDRCGVFMILEIIKEYNCSVLFCEDEETGGIGANKFIESDIAKNLIGEFNYILEFDRKGKNDAVFYNCDNSDFEDFITERFFKTSFGSFSDISIIAPYLESAAANLSCGYYNAHTKKEYVVWREMMTSIDATKDILQNTTSAETFEYIEAEKTYYDYESYWYDNYYGCSPYKGDVYLIEYLAADSDIFQYEIDANNEYEALGYFCVTHPDIPYDDVLEIRSIDEISEWGIAADDYKELGKCFDKNERSAK